MLATIADSIAYRCRHPGAPSNPGQKFPGGMSQRVPLTLFLSAPHCKRFCLCICGRESGALFPSPRPPFTGKSPVLAESLVRPLSRIPILAVGPGTRPPGGHHGGAANNPSEPDIDCRRTPLGPRIPYSFLESGRGRSADRECRWHFGGTPSGNAAGAGSRPAAWSASLRVRSCRVFVGSFAILGIILAADPDSGRGATST